MFIYFSVVSIIITNSSDSLPSTLFISAFGLLCQRFSLSLSMETSPSVFPFVSAFLILSESIIYYSLEGVFLRRSNPVHSVVPREGGAVFDRSQVTSFLRCASSYCLGSRLVVPGLEPDVRYRLPLFSVAFSGPIGDRVGS